MKKKKTKKQTIDSRANYKKKKVEVIGWLKEPSEFYTKVMGETVTRRTALLVNSIVACMIVAAIAAEGALIVSCIATVCAGYLVRRLNVSEK